MDSEAYNRMLAYSVIARIATFFVTKALEYKQEYIIIV